MKKICTYCGKKFTPKKGEESAEYCSMACWNSEHGLEAKKDDRHYNGGHKNKKRKKK